MTGNKDTVANDGVVVYSQPDCQPCRATKRALDKRGVAYTAVDVSEDKAAADYLAREGWQGTPVVEVVRGGDVVAAWQGLRVTALGALAQGDDMAPHDMRV